VNLLGYFVASRNFEFVESLQEFHQSFQTAIGDVAAAQDQGVDVFGTVRKVLEQ